MSCRQFGNIAVIALALAATSVAGLTPAYAEFPEKPIKVIVGFRAGGATDTLTKMVSQSLSEALGQAVVTQSITGGGGAVGSAAAVRAKPDGYTLLVGSNGTLTVNPQIRETGYTHESFVALGRMASVPLGWAVRSDSKIKSMGDLAAHIKSNPRTKYTSVGAGSSVHLAAALWAESLGIKDLIHIGNRGGRGAIVKLLSGEVKFITISATNFPSQLKDGKGDLRPLAVTSNGRWKYADQIPTLMEQGFDQFFYSWWGLFAPKGVPEATLATLRSAVKKVVTHPDMAANMKKFYFTPAYADHNELAKIIARDLEINRKALASLGKLRKK
jgi:tripartite-type tricarboxylate transporter receptor subunit TctC